MPNNRVMYTVQVEINHKQLQKMLDAINKFFVNEEDGEEPITIEECQAKPELMKYICESAVEDGTGMYDPYSAAGEGDLWCDVNEYR